MIFQTREKGGMGELVGPGGMGILWINNLFAVADPGGGSAPPPSYQTWCLFETEILTSTGLYITF